MTGKHKVVYKFEVGDIVIHNGARFCIDLRFFLKNLIYGNLPYYRLVPCAQGDKIMVPEKALTLDVYANRQRKLAIIQKMISKA